MTGKPAPRYVEVVSLADARTQIVVPKAKERQWVDAIEPGFYRDPENGKVYRSRPRRRWWREIPGGER
jgi:hypothetical protein